MPDREALIRNIKVGDIFYATCPNGASLLCQAKATGETAIHAQRLFMSDVTFEFNRTTGIAGSGRVPCRIDSVVPLPPDILQVLLALDHRHRTSTEPGRAKLTDAEKRALLFICNFYRENPIGRGTPSQSQAGEISAVEAMLSFWRIV
jgi:hypothetical protein